MTKSHIITSESPLFSLDLLVPPKIPFWVSWTHHINYGDFTLRFPWWTTKLDGKICQIYAAIRAENELQVREIIGNCYAKPLASIEMKFIQSQPRNWSPFRDHYQWKPWMEWD